MVYLSLSLNSNSRLKPRITVIVFEFGTECEFFANPGSHKSDIKVSSHLHKVFTISPNLTTLCSILTMKY